MYFACPHFKGQESSDSWDPKVGVPFLSSRAELWEEQGFTCSQPWVRATFFLSVKGDANFTCLRLTLRISDRGPGTEPGIKQVYKYRTQTYFLSQSCNTQHLFSPSGPSQAVFREPFPSHGLHLNLALCFHLEA